MFWDSFVFVPPKSFFFLPPYTNGIPLYNYAEYIIIKHSWWTFGLYPILCSFKNTALVFGRICAKVFLGHFTVLRMAVSRTRKQQMLGKMERNRNPWALAVGMWNSAAAMGRRVVAPHNCKHKTTIWASNSASKYIPKRIESMDSNRYLYIHVPISIIHKS